MTEEVFNATERIIALQESFDGFWTSFAGYDNQCADFSIFFCRYCVLLMQLGFAFLEAGCVRYKNMQSIMIKVFMNAAIAIIMWWVVGYGIAMGGPYSFIGQDQYIGVNTKKSKHYAEFIFQTAVGAAANSIVSGGAAERMTYGGYAILSFFFSAWIYPICVHWTWGGGWLMQLDYHDFAGSGTVHLVGAVGALVLTVMLKPRKDRFDKKFEKEFEPSNSIYIMLATLSLYMCWVFFNAGSSVAISNGAIHSATRAAANTFVSGASGALTVALLHYILNKGNNQRFSLIMLCNGNLAGLVSITGSCDVVDMWAAFVIGVIGGFIYIGANKLLFKLQIDDPVDAVPIHGFCGIFGAQWPGWFDINKGIFYGAGARQWGVQVLGVVIWIFWSGIHHFVFIYLIKLCGLLRISEEVEKKGMDMALSGCYAFAYESLPMAETSKLVEQQQRVQKVITENRQEAKPLMMEMGNFGTHKEDQS